MALRDVLTFATVAAYFLGGLIGWALCLAARKSRRYYPAISLAGVAIGVLPTYSFLIFVLRKYGVVARAADVWQLLTLCLVCATIVALGLGALGYVLAAVRDERRAARQAQAAGC